MGNRYRFEPSAATRPTLLRRRLLERLRARWIDSVVVVSAPAGFGKTTVLAQALAENARAPAGIDRWLACGPDDAMASALTAGLCEAIGVPDARLDAAGVGRAAVAVIEAMWRRSPQHVAVILDDVQHVPADSSAAELLAAIVASLPANGHLVMACRGPPPIPLARLEVAGGATWIDERDLLFTREELVEFARQRGVPPRSVVASEGWPALAELAASARSAAATDYVTQEILGALPPTARRDLALLAHLGPFDDAQARAALGRDVDISALVSLVPLVSEVPGGERAMHALWRSYLANETSPGEIAAARRRAAAVLLEQGRVSAGVRLLLDAAAWDDVLAAIVEALGAAHPPVAGDVLAEWLTRLPDDVRDEPAAQLLAAIVSMEGDPQGAWPRLEETARRFRAAGHATGELACLVQLGQLAWWSEESDRLAALVAGVFELEASGCREAIPLASLGRALLVDLLNDSRAVLAELDRIPPGAFNDVWQGVVTWLRSTSLMHLGHAHAALDAAEHALDRAGPLHEPLAEGARIQAEWFLGRIESVVEDLPRLVDRLAASGYRNYTALAAAQCGTMFALLGGKDRAAQYRARARDVAAAPSAPLVDTNLAIVTAALSIADGDEQTAAETLREHLERHPVGVGHSAAPQQRHLALFYVLVPECRATWDTADLGPEFVVARDVARALVLVRSGKGLPRRVVLPEPGIVRSHLPLRWIAELAVAASAAGRDEGLTLLDSLWPSARDSVVELARESNVAMRKAARGVLAELAVPPEGRLELSLLGPMELRRDDVLVSTPEWRRERVRALLAFLVLNGSVSRDRLADELWPKLDWTAQSANLRVTLTYLLRVLEPQRSPRDASFFIRSSGANISLRAGDRLVADVWEFDALDERAVEEDAAGSPFAALDVSLRAVDLWRGEPIELLAEPWAVPLLERRRMRFTALATRAGELLLAQRKTAAAHALAMRALTLDPWLEAAHRLVVAAHKASGNEHAARLALARYREAVADLGLHPDEVTSMVERLIEVAPAPSVARHTREPRG